MASAHVSRWGHFYSRCRRLRAVPGCSGEQLSAGRREGHESPGFVHLEPTFPDKDDVVSAIFEDLLTGKLKREELKARIQIYITAHNRMFPTQFAKFGGSALLSLDEVMFDGGTSTRGDTVSRGLWD